MRWPIRKPSICIGICRSWRLRQASRRADLPWGMMLGRAERFGAEGGLRSIHMSDEKSAPGVCRGVTTRAQDVAVDLLFVPVFQDDDRIDDLPDLDEASSGEVGRARRRGEFRGRPFELFLTPFVAGAWKAKRLALVGAGLRRDADAERLRRVAAACAYTAQLRAVDSLAVLIRRGLDLAVAAGATADGLCVAELDCASYKRPDDRA